MEYEKVLQILKDHGKEAYLVGGSVRDALRNQIPDDFDVTTNALPTELASIFKEFKLIETGIKHGTVTVLVEGKPIEITTYRHDGEYSDHRHPKDVTFTTSLEEDLSRRDFTINAMAMDEHGKIIDLFGGREDLEKGLIRAVGNPHKRFEEDALRILRALRFASTLDFEIEEETEKAMFECKELLSFVSMERCFSEIQKMLLGKGIYRILMRDLPILAVVMPPLSKMISYDQKNPHHIYDLQKHTALAVKSTPEDSVLRWAALLHDVGKPYTQSFDENGIAHYYCHAVKSAEIANEIFSSLKSDNYTREEVLFLIRHHDAPPEESKEAVHKKIRKYGEERYLKLVKLRRADNLGQDVIYHREELHSACEKWALELKKENACFKLRDLKVNGKDLLELGIENGPKIGETLNLLLDKVVSGELENDKKVLLDFTKKIKY